MAHATEERQQPRGGLTLVVLIALLLLLLLNSALRNASGDRQPFSETNLMFAALLFYAGAATLHLAFGLRGNLWYLYSASASTWLGLAANTAAGLHRWIEAGHPPLTNLYEALLSFVWALALLTVVAERRYRLRVVGILTMPLAILGVLLMQPLRSEAHPLSPLLQSNWLHIHVTLAILAYATCAISFALAMIFLIQDRVRTRTFLAVASFSNLAIDSAIVVACLEKWDSPAASGARAVLHLAPSLRFELPLSILLWALILALAVVAAPALCCALAFRAAGERYLALANRLVLAAILLQILSLALLLTLETGPASADLGFPTRLASSPFILTGLVGGILVSALFLLLAWRREELERLLPSAEILDRLTYRAICIAFPLLTLTILTGAWWANQTWGSYWNWDPKETWATITWLVYALYLHMRITVGWRGRRAAWFAIAGFGVVIFTFFGVTFLLRGMHAFL